MKKYSFSVKILSTGEVISPKGFYYQGNKHVVIVGDVFTGSTVRRKFLVSEVEIHVL